jgi:hypothetical protein
MLPAQANDDKTPKKASLGRCEVGRPQRPLGSYCAPSSPVPRGERGKTETTTSCCFRFPSPPPPDHECLPLALCLVCMY